MTLPNNSNQRNWLVLNQQHLTLPPPPLSAWRFSRWHSKGTGKFHYPVEECFRHTAGSYVNFEALTDRIGWAYHRIRYPRNPADTFLTAAK